MKKLLLTCLFLLALTTGAAAYSIDFDMPECDNPKLLEKVLARVDEYQKANPPLNIIRKREQNLLLKDLKHFQEIPSDNFTSKQDYNTANRLIEIKINKNVDSGNLKLCKSQGKGLSADIYLIVYYHLGEYIVAITNFAPDNKEFGTVY